MGCVKSKQPITIQKETRHMRSLNQNSGMFTTFNDGKTNFLSASTIKNRKQMMLNSGIISRTEEQFIEAEPLLVKKKSSKLDLKSIKEESSYEQQLTNKMESSKYSLKFSKTPSAAISMNKDDRNDKESYKDSMPATNKKFFKKGTKKMFFTFSKTRSSKKVSSYKSSSRRGGSIISSVKSNIVQEECQENTAAIVNIKRFDAGDISVGSLFSIRSPHSDTESRSQINIIDEDSDEDQPGIFTAISQSYTNSPYHTICVYPGSKSSSKVATPVSPHCPPGRGYNTFTKMEESSKTLSGFSSTKRGHYLKIKWDIFDRDNNSYRRVFILNLLKSLYQSAEYIKLQRKWKNNNEKNFGAGYINDYYYRNIFDLYNNYSCELENMFGGFKEPKEFMFPLYQILSNSIDVKFNKLMKISNPDDFHQQGTIINDKYQILDHLSSDEVYNTWSFHKCKNIQDNKLFSIRIINKNQQKLHNFRSFSTHDLHIENRMVYSKYSLKIKEIIISNSHDYVISEYVDCSLYEWIMNRKNIIKGEDSSYNLGNNLSHNTTTDLTIGDLTSNSISNISSSDLRSTFKKPSKNGVNMIKNAIGSIDDLPIETIFWKFLRNLISALDYCHNIARISHRNLNLNNIFVVKKDISLRITDYSLSSFKDQDANEEFLPCDKDILGVFPSPECLEEFNTGEAGDIWACGMIFYFMIFRDLPCKSNNLPHFFEIPSYSGESEKEINNILKSLLNPDPIERVDINSLRLNSWINQKNEFPLPNVSEDTMESIKDFISSKIMHNKLASEAA